MGTDTAAILSQLDIPPERWRKVEFYWGPGDSVTMTVTSKRGAVRKLVFPSHDAARELGRWIRQETEGVEVTPINSPGPKPTHSLAS